MDLLLISLSHIISLTNKQHPLKTKICFLRGVLLSIDVVSINASDRNIFFQMYGKAFFISVYIPSTASEYCPMTSANAVSASRVNEFLFGVPRLSPKHFQNFSIKKGLFTRKPLWKFNRMLRPAVPAVPQAEYRSPSEPALSHRTAYGAQC